VSPLDLVALGLGVAAAALGVDAHAGPVLAGLAVGVALARSVRARTAPHLVCWLVVPLLLWIGHDSYRFLAGVACLFGQSLLTALAARGRPEDAPDVAVALRVTLAAAAGISAMALISFAGIYL
jgi:uncharacterized membrane protein